MFISFVRRVIGSWLAVSMGVTALAACTSGPMTMSEMVCCAEHHDDCKMAGQAESCCAPDLQSQMGVLAAERADSYAVDAAGHVALVSTPLAADCSRFRTSILRELSEYLSIRSRSDLLNTVLLI